MVDSFAHRGHPHSAITHLNAKFLEDGEGNQSMVYFVLV